MSINIESSPTWQPPIIPQVFKQGMVLCTKTDSVEPCTSDNFEWLSESVICGYQKLEIVDSEDGKSKVMYGYHGTRDASGGWTYGDREEIGTFTTISTSQLSKVNECIKKVDEMAESKQDKLTAGDNIKIENNVISAIIEKQTVNFADIGGEVSDNEKLKTALNSKVDKSSYEELVFTLEDSSTVTLKVAKIEG